jgi:hypothetical protein
MQVTCVLTSCGRFDLLDRTMRSFFEFNTFPIKRFIIIDDSGYINAAITIKEMVDKLKIHEPPEFIVIANEHNIGQVKSIDWAYFHVETEYIFHMEDDWEFYAPGFIEESALIMQSNPWIITVWIRAHNDTNGHPIEKLKDLEYPLMSLGYADWWHGFTWNPSLRRLADYEMVDGEAAAGRHYMRKGFRAAISNKEDGYVKHIGWDNSTAHIEGTNKG